MSVQSGRVGKRCTGLAETVAVSDLLRFLFVCRDICPILKDPKALAAVTDLFEEHVRRTYPHVDLIVGKRVRRVARYKVQSCKTPDNPCGGGKEGFLLDPILIGLNKDNWLNKMGFLQDFIWLFEFYWIVWRWRAWFHQVQHVPGSTSLLVLEQHYNQSCRIRSNFSGNICFRLTIRVRCFYTSDGQTWPFQATFLQRFGPTLIKLTCL